MLKLRRAIRRTTGMRIPPSIEYPLNRFKPVHILCDRLVSNAEIALFKEALDLVLERAEVKEVIPVEVYGNWFKDGGEFGSIEWYIKQAYNAQRKQCDLIKFLNLFKKEPWQKLPHYDLLLLSSYDLYDSTSPEIKFFTGRGSMNATVISLFRLKKQGSEVLKQTGIHEFGHTYGSLPDCKNACSMRSPEFIPSDLIIHARDRLKYGIFCQVCESKLKQAFWQLPSYYQHFPEVLELLDGLAAKEPEILEKVKSGEIAKVEVTIDWI
ncbi:MAG: hypothetical protein QXL78_04005 [Methanocellales archaeon]